MAEAVLGILREDGVEVLLEGDGAARQSAGSGVRISVATAAGERTMEGSHVLRAAGRVPNTDRLDLPAAGIAMDDKGFIAVSPRLETTVPGVYALGDVKGGPAFTHISYDDFRIIRTNLLQGGRACITDRLVPYTVFIDPQFGRVGLNEKDARRQGRPSGWRECR